MRFKVWYYTFLVFVIISAFFFRNNADRIYSTLGNHYYKHNNIEKAIFYYEKAIKLDNRNYKVRENYVNSIINSPLTIESQEKLVSITEDDIADSASSNAKYFLYNLKREIHNKYPKNYILQAPDNQKIVHWGKLPITYSFKNQYSVNDNLIKAVDDAFNEWERASSCKVKFKHVKINPEIWIEFIRENIESPEYGRKYVVAYTTPIISGDKLENMVIKLNTLDLEGKDYTPNQIYNTALHEIFHALGFMGHSYDKENIMYMAKNSDAIVNDTKVTLSQADKTTLDLLYKIKPDITNASELEYNYVPYLVLGGNDDVNYTKLKEAKNYIKKAPSLSGGYIDLAEALVEQKKYKEASDCLIKAYRLANNNDMKYIVLYNLAISYYYQGMYELSLDYIESAKEIKDEEDLHTLSAEIYLKQNSEHKAISEYEYLITNYPKNIEHCINLANIYLNKHKYIKARNVLKNYLKINPEEKNNPKLNRYKNLFL